MWPFGKSTADRVKDALNEQPRLKDLGLQVQESGGSVTVSGMVPNDRYGGLVRVIAEGISGVKSVDVSGLVPQETTSLQRTSAPSTGVETPDLQPVTPTRDIQTGHLNADASAGAPQGNLEAEISEVEDRSRTAKAVLAALRGNGELADDPIDVLQSGRSIILRGVVDSEHEQRLAEQLAREVDGVAGVDISGLRVAAGAKELAREKDQDSGDTVYTVKAGDTLSEIAQKYYGDAMQYKKIAHYNNISNPDLIQPGQKIRIPG